MFAGCSHTGRCTKGILGITLLNNTFDSTGYYSLQQMLKSACNNNNNTGLGRMAIIPRPQAPKPQNPKASTRPYPQDKGLVPSLNPSIPNPAPLLKQNATKSNASIRWLKGLLLILPRPGSARKELSIRRVVPPTS